MKKFSTAFVALLLVVLMVIVAARSGLRVIYPQKYDEYVLRYSEEYGVDADLIYAVIHTESSFNPDSTSNVGALGLMQIMPDTFDWLNFRMHEEGDFESLRDAEVSIRYGTYLLKLLTEEFPDTRTALAAYHAGRGRVSEWLQESSYSQDGKTLQTIPYSDTAHYVRKVERALQIYKSLYDGQQ